MTKEYFVVALSNPAPWFPDTDTFYIEAKSPKRAIMKVRKTTTHKAGLASIRIWHSADDYHKKMSPIAKG
jgi:hypothetical protein